MADITLKCHCGRMGGTARAVSPSAGFRFFCYCMDCQAFARFLERPDILDAAGGTDIFQMPPVQVTFTAGFEALRCVRLSSKVLRWYADCCRTPIANTAAGPRFPVVALIHSIMDGAADELSRIARGAAAIASCFCLPCNKGCGLVDARTRPAKPVLR